MTEKNGPTSGAQCMTRGSGLKMEHRRFPLNVRKCFVMMRVIEQGNRLPRVVVESPSSEILKRHGPGQPAVGSLAW